MKRGIAILASLGLALPAGCGAPGPRSSDSFDTIRQRVVGRSAAEVEALLGRPDSRQRLATGDENWTWWNYTDLRGAQYAPEVRHQIVHLEVLLACDGGVGRGPGAAGGPARCRVDDPLAVSYSHPGAGE